MSKANLILAVLAVAGGALACDDEPEVGRQAHVASAACPLKTPAEWQAFLETTVDDPAWVTTCSDQQDCDSLVGEFARALESEVIGVLESCAQDVADNPIIDRCTSRLRRYIPAWSSQHDEHSYGFRQDNAGYFAAHEGPDVPDGMMEPPAVLLAALPERETLEQVARSNGWPSLTHDSCLGGVRTFIAVSDGEDRFDQWLLVGLDESATATVSGSIMSFIAVQKKDASGVTLPRVRLHFRDYVIAAGAGSWELSLPQDYGGKCYACHGSGLRQLLPFRGALISSAFERLGSLNQRLTDYGLPDWNGSIEPADHGPPLGESLGCTRCHNGVLRGVLTVSTSEGMLWQKMVEQLAMRSSLNGEEVPDQAAMALLERERSGLTLTPEQAAELERARAEHLADYEQLVADRLPSWQRWALEEPCEINGGGAF